MSLSSTDFIVNKKQLNETKFVETQIPSAEDLAPGQALLKVDQFAFTANNVTYAIAGDRLRYWDFFPTEDGYGRIPVWGFAEVVASKSDGAEVGERVYGYLPMSTYLVVTPGNVTPQSFMDVAEHRSHLSPIYNQYSRTAVDPSYSPESEGQISIFRPLFTTSFLLDDYQGKDNFFGASSVVLSSASSKTSIGTAFLLSKRDNVRVIGLTSPGNVSFVEGLGIYDQVLTYDEIESLPVEPTNFVDMAGNGEVITRIHNHFGDQLKDSSMVGITHWQKFGRSGEALPGPKPTMFFAPGYAQERIRDWGMDGFQQRVGAAWVSFIPTTADWITVKHGRGKDAVNQTYLNALMNKTSPSEGHIVSLWD